MCLLMVAKSDRLCLSAIVFVLACVASAVDRVYATEELVVEALQRLGARVETDAQGVVTLVHLEGKPVTDDDLNILAGLDGVTRLYLADTPISDVGLRHVSQLEELQRLSLWKTRITDAGLAHLARLKKLEVLDLNNTAVSDAGIAHLAKLETLTFLQDDLSGNVAVWLLGLADNLDHFVHLLIEFRISSHGMDMGYCLEPLVEVTVVPGPALPRAVLQSGSDAEIDPMMP